MTLATERTKDDKQGQQAAASTRDIIMDAARKVFSRYPYHSATLRMVGKEARINHQAIAYYFPSKADLFEAVASETCDDFHGASQKWFEGLDKAGPEEGLRLFVERLLEYHYQKPEALRMMALNAPMIENLDDIPGHQHIIQTRARSLESFKKNLHPNIDRKMLLRLVATFDTAIIYYLGAAPSQAQVLGMDPGGDAYKTWVKETMVCVFVPFLKGLVSPEKTGSRNRTTSRR